MVIVYSYCLRNLVAMAKISVGVGFDFDVS